MKRLIKRIGTILLALALASGGVSAEGIAGALEEAGVQDEAAGVQDEAAVDLFQVVEDREAYLPGEESDLADMRVEESSEDDELSETAEGETLSEEGDLTGNEALSELDGGEEIKPNDPDKEILFEPNIIEEIESFSVFEGVALLSESDALPLTDEGVTLTVNGVSVLEGSGEGWVYTDHILYLNADGLSVSGNADGTRIELSAGAALNGLSGEASLVFCSEEAALMLYGTNEVASLKANVLALSGTGTLNTLRAEASALTVFSGTLKADALLCDSCRVSGGTLKSGCADLIQDMTLTAGSLELSGLSCLSFRQTGGQANFTGNVTAAEDFRATAGLLGMNGSGTAVKCINAELGGTLTAHLSSGTRLFQIKTLLIDGINQPYLASVKELQIENGVMRTDLRPLLAVDGTTYGLYEIEAGTAHGNGWRYDHVQKKLVLRDYSGSIAAYLPLTIEAPGGTASELTLECMGDLTLCGEGTLNGRIHSGYGTVNIEMRGASKLSVDCTGTLAVKNSLLLDGNLKTQDAISVTDSEIRAGKLDASGSVTLKNSLVRTMDRTGGTVDLHAGGKLTLNGSILLCENLSCGSFAEDRASMLFEKCDGVYTLKNDPVLTRDWVLPDGVYAIPAGRTLTAKTLYVPTEPEIAGHFRGTLKLLGQNETLTLSGAPIITIGTRTAVKAEFSGGGRTEAVWRMDAPEGCTIDAEGTVFVPDDETLIGKTLTVTARSLWDESVSGSWMLTIVPKAERIEPESTWRELYLDPWMNTLTLGWGVYPENANPGLVWYCSNAKIAAVGGDGTVRAKKAGTVQVWAAATDGSGVVSPRITVVVRTAPKKVKLNVKKLTLGYDAVQGLGTQAALKAALNAGAGSCIRYSSSNSRVAVVSPEGVITATGIGKVKITAKTYNGKKATCTVTVVAAARQLSLYTHELTIGQGDRYGFGVWIPGKTASSWSFSSNTETVGRMEGGTFVAEAVGTCEVTVESFNGLTDTCAVTVLPAPDAVTLNAEQISLGIKESFWLMPTGTTVDGREACASYRYYSSNPKVVQVSGNRLTARKRGSAVITVVSHNGVKAVCTVNVYKKPNKIRFECGSYTLSWNAAAGEGMNAQLRAILPKGASSRIAYTSSAPSVAVVDENGIVTAVGIGSAKITAKTYNGKKAVCTIRVLPTPETVALDRETYKVAAGGKIGVRAVLPSGTCTETLTYGSEAACFELEGSTVYAKAVGTGTIRVTTAEGVVGTADVCVLPAPDEICANDLIVKVKKSARIGAEAVCSNGSETVAVLSYSSSNPKVAAVSGSGMVTGKKVGKAWITIRTDTGLEKAILVTVTK